MADQVLIPFDQREAMTLQEAAKTSTFSVRTVRRWCEEFGIGRKVGGVWRVSRIALQMYLDDNGSALMAYRRGERNNPIVAIYFAQFSFPEVGKSAISGKSAKTAIDWLQKVSDGIVKSEAM